MILWCLWYLFLCIFKLKFYFYISLIKIINVKIQKSSHVVLNFKLAILFYLNLKYALIIYKVFEDCFYGVKNPVFVLFIFYSILWFCQLLHNGQREFATNKNRTITIQRYYNFIREYFISMFILFLKHSIIQFW